MIHSLPYVPLNLIYLNCRYPGSEIYRHPHRDRENYHPIQRLPPGIDPAMLRTRQFPEVSYFENLDFN